LQISKISRRFDIAEPSLYRSLNSGDSRRAFAVVSSQLASGRAGEHIRQPASFGQLPRTWINCATKGGSVSNSTSSTVN
jgi:hypothetical protein